MRALALFALLLTGSQAWAEAAWPANLFALRYVGSPGGTDHASGYGAGDGTSGALTRGWTHGVELSYVRGAGPVHVGATLGYARAAAALDESVAGTTTYRDELVQHQIEALASLEFHIPFNRTRFCRRIRDYVHPWLGMDVGPGVTVTTHAGSGEPIPMETHTFFRVRGRVGVLVRLYGPLAVQIFGHFGGDNATAGLLDPGTAQRVQGGAFRFVGGLGAGLAAMF